MSTYGKFGRWPLLNGYFNEKRMGSSLPNLCGIRWSDLIRPAHVPALGEFSPTVHPFHAAGIANGGST
jgi:hypothetical protein